MMGKITKERWYLIAAILLGSITLFIYPGYIFMLDFVFVPNMSSGEFTGRPSYLFYLLIEIMSHAIPVYVIQRLILLGVVVLCAVGVSRLVLYVVGRNANWLVVGFGVFLYLFNPFVYSRLMTGQIAVLLGYSLMPLIAVSLMKFFVQPSWSRVVILAILTTIVSVVSIHTLGLLLVLAASLGTVQVYKQRKRFTVRSVKNIMLKLSLGIVIFLVANAYWIIPILFGKSKTVDTIAAFGSLDLAAFATNGETLGVLGNVLLMQGFWADVANLYLLPQDVYSWWWIPYLFLGLLMTLGLIKIWKKSRDLAVSLLLVFVIATILATGVSGSFFAPINQWLFDHVPFYAGYREPQKFAALIVFVYVILASVGVSQLVKGVSIWYVKYPWIIKIFTYSVLLVPLTIAPLLWQNVSILKSSDYPEDWYRMENYLLSKTSESDKILALPWHMYMRFGFAGRVIANPMDDFFTSRVIVSEDPEYKGISGGQSDNKYSSANLILLEKDSSFGRESISNYLLKMGITYILVAKEFDYEKYGHLNSQPGFVIVRDTQTLRLYKIEPVKME